MFSVFDFHQQELHDRLRAGQLRVQQDHSLYLDNQCGLQAQLSIQNKSLLRPLPQDALVTFVVFGQHEIEDRSAHMGVYNRERPRLLQERSIRFFKEEIIFRLKLSDRYRQSNRLVKAQIHSLRRMSHGSQCRTLRSVLPPPC